MKLIYLNKLWRECEEGCKSVFKEMEDISKKRKLAAYIRNKNILCFRIKYLNSDSILLLLPSTRWF